MSKNVYKLTHTRQNVGRYSVRHEWVISKINESDITLGQAGHNVKIPGISSAQPSLEPFRAAINRKDTNNKLEDVIPDNAEPDKVVIVKAEGLFLAEHNLLKKSDRGNEERGTEDHQWAVDDQKEHS